MIYNTLNKTIFLRASTEQVWAYLTDPDKLGLWFHKPKAPLVQRETYAMFATQSGDKLMWGYVTRAQPHDLLEYTFIITPMGDATSTVKWTLDAVAGDARLSLEHSGLPASEDAFVLTLALDRGWDDHFDPMRAACRQTPKNWRRRIAPCRNAPSTLPKRVAGFCASRRLG